MKQKKALLLILSCLFLSLGNFAQSPADTLVQRDLLRDPSAPAGFEELQIPSHGSLMQGFIYIANGKEKHPTVLLLHGFPGNERNLDLAQAVRVHGWNVIYFNYRGSWGSQGEFSFDHCVEDVLSVYAFCAENNVRLKIDTSRIVLFGHSMGGWVCLKALQKLPSIKKGFAMSAWNIPSSLNSAESISRSKKEADGYFVLNKKSGAALFQPVIDHPGDYDLARDGIPLAEKQIIMIDEHHHNAAVAEALRKANRAYFDYEVWDTDHPFTNKRVSLIRKFIAFLDR